MLLEISNYEAGNNERDALIDHFELAVVPLVDKLGGSTVGSFRGVGDARSYWVFRSYKHVEERASFLRVLEGSAEWNAVKAQLRKHSPADPKLTLCTPTPRSRFQGQRGGSGGPRADVMEIRFYRTKPGVRDPYIVHYESRVLPAFEKFGARIAGQFVNLEDPDSFIWLWPFRDAATQERLQDTIYDSEMWRGSLRTPTIAFLADYSNVVTVAPTERSEFRG